MSGLASAVAPRPVLIVTANDGSDQFASPFAAALRAKGDTQVSISRFDTDHLYSGYRLALEETVLAFLYTEQEDSRHY